MTTLLESLCKAGFCKSDCGTPYGASHVAGPARGSEPTAEERRLAHALGRRLAMTALKLAA